jgi:hypothetical protein
MTGFIGLLDTARTPPHNILSTVTTSLPLLGSGFQRWMFPFLWVPELFPASGTSFLQQQLTTTEPPLI